jgi:hypothetical protein
MKRPARADIALDLRHIAAVGAEFAEFRVQLLAVVEPVHDDLVVGVVEAGDREARLVGDRGRLQVAAELVVCGQPAPFPCDLFETIACPLRCAASRPASRSCCYPGRRSPRRPILPAAARSCSRRRRCRPARSYRL